MTPDTRAASGEGGVDEAPLLDGASAPDRLSTHHEGAEGSPSADAARADDLTRRAFEQIRGALATLCYASDGFYEDEAQVALDALDWLEEL